MVSQVLTTLFGKTDDGEEIYKFTIENKNGLTLEVINYGAIITGIKCPDKNGKFDDITLGFDDFEGYYRLNVPYFGATIGRVCNRIANGRFQIDGVTYHLPVNDPPNSLHGGWKGFDKRVWDHTVKDNSVTFSRVSSDGEEGYPGNLTVQATYGLNDDNEIHCNVTATTDKATIVNITSHSFFNLAGQTNANVLNHTAQITAESYLSSDSIRIPTGEIVPVKDTPAFDFTVAKEFGRDVKQTPNHGYDNNYCITNPGDITKLQARVTEPNSGRGIEIYTTQPGIQLYTANDLDGGIVGKGGIAYPKYGAFCLETQNWPDAIHHENFPNSILRPGDTYTETTIYKLFVFKTK